MYFWVLETVFLAHLVLVFIICKSSFQGTGQGWLPTGVTWVERVAWGYRFLVHPPSHWRLWSSENESANCQACLGLIRYSLWQNATNTGDFPVIASAQVTNQHWLTPWGSHDAFPFSLHTHCSPCSASYSLYWARKILERLSSALLFRVCIVLVHPSPQIFVSWGLIITFHTLFCGLWLWAEVFTRWVSCQTGPIASLFLLHLGSGWVFPTENFSFSTLPDMSNATVLLPANTAPSRSFYDNITSALAIYPAPWCCLRNWPHHFLILNSKFGARGTNMPSTDCCETLAGWWAHPVWNLSSACPCTPEPMSCARDHELPGWAQQTQVLAKIRVTLTTNLKIESEGLRVRFLASSYISFLFLDEYASCGRHQAGLSSSPA